MIGLGLHKNAVCNPAAPPHSPPGGEQPQLSPGVQPTGSLGAQLENGKKRRIIGPKFRNRIAKVRSDNRTTQSIARGSQNNAGTFPPPAHRPYRPPGGAQPGVRGPPAPHPHRASTRRWQRVTVYVPPDVASQVLPKLQSSPALHHDCSAHQEVPEYHPVPSARTAQVVLQPWAATTAMEVASFGASTHPAGSGR